MPSTFENLSGASYVAARLRKPDTDADRKKFTKVRIASTKYCDHTQTICASADCVDSWMIDWQFFPERTVGGRRLLSFGLFKENA